MTLRKKIVWSGCAVLVVAVILLLTASRQYGPESISIHFVAMTNSAVGPTNASWTMYVVTNHTSKGFRLVGFKFLVKKNLRWVEEPSVGMPNIPWEIARLLRGGYEGNGFLSAGGSFHVFLPALQVASPRKTSLCFVNDQKPPSRLPSSNPSLLQGLREEAGAKLDGILHREFEYPIPEPVR